MLIVGLQIGAAVGTKDGRAGTAGATAAATLAAAALAVVVTLDAFAFAGAAGLAVRAGGPETAAALAARRGMVLSFAFALGVLRAGASRLGTALAGGHAGGGRRFGGGGQGSEGEGGETPEQAAARPRMADGAHERIEAR
jgi:hypothetical protein